jgi:hypothetical protein
MARSMPFLVRIACRYPHRGCYLSAGNAAIPVLKLCEMFAQEKQCPETKKASRVHDIPEEKPGEPDLPVRVFQPAKISVVSAGDEIPCLKKKS